MNPETQTHVSADGGSAPSECGEAPAVEGLLLLQHVSGTSTSVTLPRKRQVEKQQTPEENLESEIRESSICVNPIHELLGKGRTMNMADTEAEFYRGVYLHPKHSLYYCIIQASNQYHFLGFHLTAIAAAQAWDLATMKRAMDAAQNLSAANTNFRLEEYVRLESIMSMLVVISFDELVEVLVSMNRQESEIGDLVEATIQGCQRRHPDEFGNVSIATERAPATSHSDSMSNSLTLDELHELISTTKTLGNKQSAWVRRIRDSKKWKGVYFSKDGVPYSKVEIDGDCHYLGRFETVEAAAKAYDLATLKRAMLNDQPAVSLNFPKDEYLKEKSLMDFLYTADSEEVIHYIRKMAHYQRGGMCHDQHERLASKRQKLDSVSSSGTLGLNHQHRHQHHNQQSSMQHIDWGSLGLGQRPLTRTLSHSTVPGNAERCAQSRPNLVEAGDEASDSGRRQEMQVERRICDANMTALLRDSRDWVRVALNAVALKMTASNINVIANQAILPGDVAEWFGATDKKANEAHAVELVNACGQQSFHFVCYVARDHCRFAANCWNHFVDEIGLTSGDILVLLKSETRWKLSYAVFVLPDAVMPEAFSLSRGRRTVPGFSPGPPAPPPPVYVSSPPVIRPSVPPHMIARPAKRTLQAHVLPSAQGLTGIQVIQKTRDGRLLVEASLVRDPTAGLPSDPGKRQLFVIPANSVQTTSLMRPPANYINNNRPAHPGFQIPPNPAGRFPYVPQPSRVQPAPRPACLPSVPIRVNIRGGIKALTKKTDSNLYMVADSNGQMRLVTSQSPGYHHSLPRGRTQQSVTYGPTVEGEPVVAYPSPYFPNATTSSTPRPTADRVSRTSPEVTVIDPSTTGSDASGTGTEKPLHQVQQEEHSSGNQVIDLVDDDQREKTEKQGDSCTDMYTLITKIIENCNSGLDSDIAKKFKLAFANKMTPGQQLANYTELKNLSQAGKWGDVCEWIKSTVESF